MTSRLMPLLVAAILCFALIACAPQDSQDDVPDEPGSVQSPIPGATATPPNTPAPTSTPTPEPTSTPAPEPIVHEFSGTGSRVLGPFDVVEGVLVVNATHNGARNFVVRVVGAESEELSVNTIGRYSGAVGHAVSRGSFFGLKPGPVRIQIDADGEWAVEVRQDFPTGGQHLPVETNGTGNNVFRWIVLEEGQTVLRATHDGRRNFVIYLIAADGSETHLIANAIGSYDGEHLISVRRGSLSLDPSPGLHALAVQADGDWTVAIE